jgi:hypothetical protein
VGDSPRARGVLPDMRRLFSTVTMVLTAACSSPVEPAAVNLDQVIFTPRAPNIRISNRTFAPVYTFIVGRNASAVVDWFPCVREDCPSIPPFTTVTKRYDESFIDASETEALVYWWHAEVVNGERRAGVVRSGVVRVR